MLSDFSFEARYSNNLGMRECNLSGVARGDLSMHAAAERLKLLQGGI